MQKVNHRKLNYTKVSHTKLNHTKVNDGKVNYRSNNTWECIDYPNIVSAISSFGFVYWRRVWLGFVMVTRHLHATVHLPWSRSFIIVQLICQGCLESKLHPSTKTTQFSCRIFTFKLHRIKDLSLCN